MVSRTAEECGQNTAIAGMAVGFVPASRSVPDFVTAVGLNPRLTEVRLWVYTNNTRVQPAGLALSSRQTMTYPLIPSSRFVFDAETTFYYVDASLRCTASDFPVIDPKLLRTTTRPATTTLPATKGTTTTTTTTTQAPTKTLAPTTTTLVPATSTTTTTTTTTTTVAPPTTTRDPRPCVCPKEVIDGHSWEETPCNGEVFIPCPGSLERFVWRACGPGGIWTKRLDSRMCSNPVSAFLFFLKRILFDERESQMQNDRKEV